MNSDYTCKICGKVCKNSRALSAHIFNVHVEFRKNLKLYFDTYIEPGKEHICKFCGAPTKFLNLSKGYSTTCGSVVCGHELEKETRNTKYGQFESNNGINAGQEKYKKTMLEKYGVEHNWASAELRKNGQCKTCLEKYGNRNFNNSKKMVETKKSWSEEEQQALSKKISNSLMKISPEKKKEISERIQQKRKPKMNEIVQKIKTAWDNKTDSEKDEIYRKSRSHIKSENDGFLSRSEKKFAEMLNNRKIPFIYDFLHNKKHWDFLVNSEILVEIDGEYNHGLLSDSDGINVKGNKDEERFEKSYPYKLLVVDSKNIENSFQELFSMMNVNYNEYIENMVNSLSGNFPEISYTEKRMKLDWKHLCEYKNWNKWQKLGNSIIMNFHKSIWKCNLNGKLSPFEAWNDKEMLKKCVMNRFIYESKLSSQNILRGFNVCKLAPKVSVFNPSLASHLVKKYLDSYDEVFDPMSGFSGRMLGVCANNKKYIGQDINQITIDESSKIIDFLNLNAKITTKDCLDDYGKYDCLFTCPPYRNKENWCQEIKNFSCDEWIDECLKRYDCKTYMFVVDETTKYKENIVETLENCSHFGVNNEYVILIKKI
jgi:hypothetical protein